jgi:hypothetical protein
VPGVPRAQPGVETVQDVERFPWPDPLDAARFVGMREAVREMKRLMREARPA